MSILFSLFRGSFFVGSRPGVALESRTAFSLAVPWRACVCSRFPEAWPITFQSQDPDLQQLLSSEAFGNFVSGSSAKSEIAWR